MPRCAAPYTHADEAEVCPGIYGVREKNKMIGQKKKKEKRGEFDCRKKKNAARDVIHPRTPSADCVVVHLTRIEFVAVCKYIEN
jgi:hypothetical protein